ncbi:putative exported protein [Citrobacter rodentium ICC168]|uniref:Exported protein n=1 Tax=Citrobacter rodentium (strain ICC168) TaxID=637910 RepID=D2TNH7_CITRI|nr:putative exported protein [Citrobacter rodentium ICC168]
MKYDGVDLVILLVAPISTAMLAPLSAGVNNFLISR